jgi:hypothetical protein
MLEKFVEGIHYRIEDTPERTTLVLISCNGREVRRTLSGNNYSIPFEFYGMKTEQGWYFFDPCSNETIPLSQITHRFMYFTQFFGEAHRLCQLVDIPME